MRASILLLVTGCSDPAASCGPGMAPLMGLDARAGSLTLDYGSLAASANNDCPAPDAPAGVIALRIKGTGGDNLHGTGLINLCIGRPDKLNDGLSFGADPESVELTDLVGVDENACTYGIDDGVPITGTARSTDLCSAGTDPAGFALAIDASLSLKRTCNGVIDSLAFTLAGTVAVAGP